MFLKLVAFLLITPQLSIHFVNIKIDSYVVLLLILFIRFIYNSPKYLYKEVFFYISLFLLFSYTLIMQFLFNTSGVEIQAHTTYSIYREVDTFGSAPLSGNFDYHILIRIIGILLFSFLLFDFLKKKHVKQLIEFFKNILYMLAFIQIIFYILFKINYLDSFIRSFLPDNIHEDGSLGIAMTIREGFIRVAGGFSEPSFLAIIYFIAIFSLFLILKNNKLNLSNKDKIFILISWIVVLLTTISFTHFISLVLVIWILFDFNKFFLAFGMLIFLLFFEFIVFMEFDFLKYVNASFISRIYFNTNFENFETSKIFFGTEITHFYNFILSKNLILQLGSFGTFIWFLILIIFLRDKYFLLILGVLLILFISPRFTDTFLYIAFSFFLTIKYKQENSLK